MQITRVGYRDAMDGRFISKERLPVGILKTLSGNAFLCPVIDTNKELAIVGDKGSQADVAEFRRGPFSQQHMVDRVSQP